MENYAKNCNKHRNQQKNSQKSKQNSLPLSHDSGLSPEIYDKNMTCESSEYLLLHGLNKDLNELRLRLHKSDMEKEELKLKIRQLLDEKTNIHQHIESINISHENRITEMHCIIVELNKKLKMQNDNAIAEEPELEEGSELSFQEGSIIGNSNSESEAPHRHQQSNIDEFDFEQKLNLNDQDFQTQKDNHHHHHHRDDVECVQNNICSSITTQHNAAQIQCMQEEILQLRSKIALLQSELASYEKSRIDERADDNCECKNEKIKLIQASEDDQESAPECYKDEYLMKQPTNVNVYNKFKSNESAPIAKVVKLNTANDESKSSNEQYFDKEQLISHLLEPESERDVVVTSSDETYNRLHRRIEQLKIQNSLLSLNLSESKQHCNHLYLLCGKYESNAIALQQALNCNDRAIESYDVLLALLESKLAMLEDRESADQNRKVAESVAHSLLNRLQTETSFSGKSMAPWQEAVVLLPDSESMPWTDEHDRMLRNQVSKLKGQRSFIQNTVVNLESPFNLYDNIDSKIELLSSKHRSCCKNSDIESTILIQELMSLKDELCDLKSQAKQSEREKNLAHEKLKSMSAALYQFQSQLGGESLPKDRHSYSEAEYNATLERELLEALSRECRLKTRLQGLVDTVTKVNSSTKYNVEIK